MDAKLIVEQLRQQATHNEDAAADKDQTTVCVDLYSKAAARSAAAADLIEAITKERDNARAECAWLAKQLLHERWLLSSIAGDVEDEGGRVYFGKTADADDLKEFADKVEDYDFDRITRASEWPDYIEMSLAAHNRTEELGTRLAAAAAVLQGFLRCPEIADCAPEDRDPETRDLERLARAIVDSTR